MKEIFSKQNSIIKELKKQKLKNRFLLFLDNPKSITDAIMFGLKPQIVLVQKDKTEKFSSFLTEQAIITSKEVIADFSSTKTPQGVLAVFELPAKTPSLPKGNFLVLDGLQDAGNVGTLLRSALGANFMDVFLVDCVALSNDKLVRSSMSAILRLNVCEVSRAEFVQFANKHSLNLCTAQMQGDNVFECNFGQNLGVVVGSEGQGVSAELDAIAKCGVTIPMANGLESLNAGVAGSIIMFEINNKKGK